MASSTFHYNAGVVPGCKLANRLVLCLTLPLLLELQADYPSIHAVALLDDWSFHAIGADLDAEETLVQVTTRAVQWFGDNNLPLAAGKCKVVANRRAGLARLMQQLGPMGFTAEGRC
eukprot:3778020-Amphidinium_carterae.1